MVRCKFRVESVTQFASSKWDAETKKSTPCTLHSVSMSPVYSEDPSSENKKFWDATPSGKLEFQCVKAEAVSGFEIGKEYYIDIHPAN
jgi:hypothetical protein